MIRTPDVPFGARLRSARTDRGLSQAELGGDAYSASYISHLESGRRQPTPEVVRHLAFQLQLDPAWFSVDDPKAADSIRLSAALAVVEARVHNAVLARDYSSVIEEVSHAELTAHEHPSIWWSVVWAKAESQLALGFYEACRETASELASSQLAAVSPELHAAALSLTARAERAAGHLERSLTTARDAVRSGSIPAPARAVALRELIASLAELDLLDEVVEAASELDTIRADITDSQLLGLVAWTIGNVAFITGDAARGELEHGVASEYLRPAADLRLWGRFHKASAAMHLHAGRIDGVDRAIARAAHALELVGNASDQAELCLLRAERALPDDPEAALHLTREGLGLTTLSYQTHAEGLVIQARALQALGHYPEARATLNDAALAFDSAGAHRRSADIWRELATQK